LRSTARSRLLKREGRKLGSYARHYYDLFQFSLRPEVLAKLQSAEYTEIKTDYDRVSREHFPNSYFFPEEMRFATSDALFPTGELAAMVPEAYTRQCELLCFGNYPTWEEVAAGFEEFREHLFEAVSMNSQP
jgi:hypothetical protein